MSKAGQMIDGLERGGLIKVVLSMMMRLAALLILVGTGIGILMLLYQILRGMGDMEFSLSSLTMLFVAIWGVVIIALMGFAYSKILEHRASKVKELPEGRVIPITSQLIRTSGELYAVSLLCMGLSPALAVIGKGLLEIPRSLLYGLLGYGEFSQFIVAILAWGIGVLIFALLAVLVLATFYMLAESTLLLIEISDNTKKSRS